MSEHRETVDALATLMSEFGLAEAKLTQGELSISFRHVAMEEAEGSAHYAMPFATAAPVAEVEVPRGTPIASPMNGIYYGSPSPNAPAFVKEGDTITAGQVVGLIEAMKVFNEIPAPISGTVLKVLVESGALVQPGDTLLLIG